ncbi:MAG: ATP-binding cassette domain-containing protein [Acidobacteria bacterium]|nr:ATP-binding cassette domain-containing protein [Acidobacteriota bacterium]
MFAARRLEVPGLPPLAFEVPPGEVLAVSGPSGSGKTRLLRALADLDPHGGQLSWSGRSCAEMPAPEWRRKVGLLPAEPRFWHSTVGAHFPAEANSLGEELASLRLDPETRKADPMLLSTGERSRLALMRLLLRSPEVLLLDEPTANLDEGNRALVVARIDRYRRHHGAPVVWVSHLAEVVAAADRVLLLPEGNVGLSAARGAVAQETSS